MSRLMAAWYRMILGLIGVPFVRLNLNDHRIR